MFRSTKCGVGVLSLMMVGFSLPAGAQDAKAEVSGGYQFISGKSPSDTEWTNFPKGWYVDVAGNVTKMLGIVGQVGGNYKTQQFAGESADLKVHEYLVGARVSSRRSSMVVPFGQILIGGVNIRESSGSNSDSQNHFGVQVGAGANVMANKKVGARIGVDYLRIKGKDGDEGVNVFRFVVGVVIPVGTT